MEVQVSSSSNTDSYSEDHSDVSVSMDEPEAGSEYSSEASLQPARGRPRKIINAPKGKSTKDAKAKKVKKGKKTKKPTNFDFFYNRTLFRYIYDFLKRQYFTLVSEHADMS